MLGSQVDARRVALDWSLCCSSAWRENEAKADMKPHVGKRTVEES